MVVLHSVASEVTVVGSVSAVFTARLSDLVNSANCLRAFWDVSLASSKDCAVLSRCGRRDVKLKFDHVVCADWRGDRSVLLVELTLLVAAVATDVMLISFVLFVCCCIDLASVASKKPGNQSADEMNR